MHSDYCFLYRSLSFVPEAVMKAAKSTGKVCENLMKNIDIKTIFAKHRIADDGLRCSA